MSSNLLDYRLASPHWFRTQPRWGLTSTSLPAAVLPRVNSPVGLPLHFLLQEATHYLLAAATIFLAARRGRAGLWLGIAVAGFALEAFGIILAHEHMHPQFVFMLGAVPAKEVAVYPVLLFTAFTAADFLCLRSRTAEALAVACLHVAQVVQYEAVAYRAGILFVAANPDFPLANMNDVVLKGPWVNVYANFAIAYCAARALRGAVEDDATGAVGGTLRVAVETLVRFAVGGMAPLAAMKLAGCVATNGSKVFRLSEVATPLDLLESYGECASKSPVLESRVVGLCVSVSAMYVALNVRSSLLAASSGTGVQEEARRRWNSTDAWIVVSVVFLFHAFVGVVSAGFDKDTHVSKADAAMLWVSMAVVGVGSAFFCALGLKEVGGEDEGGVGVSWLDAALQPSQVGVGAVETISERVSKAGGESGGGSGDGIDGPVVVAEGGMVAGEHAKRVIEGRS